MPCGLTPPSPVRDEPRRGESQGLYLLCKGFHASFIFSYFLCLVDGWLHYLGLPKRAYRYRDDTLLLRNATKKLRRKGV